MVHLKPLKRSNPQDAEAPDKYYAKAVGNGVTDLHRLAHLIANQSTVRKADCLAVLQALQHNISDELGQGRIVKLGDFGTFQVGVRSNGVDTEEEVSKNLVKSAHLNFRPGRDFQSLLKTLSYKLVG